MLDLAVLGLLKEADLHGYELKKRLTESLGSFSRVSFGSLYPALGRLEAAGAVRAVSADERRPIAGPMTGSLGGELAAFRARRTETRDQRGKKVYSITEQGQRLFEQLLSNEEATDDDRSFCLRLSFARHLTPQERLGLLERRRAHLVERLSRARSAIRSGRERLDAYSRSLLEHNTDTTERDIGWLDQLIASERAATHDPLEDR